VHGFQLRIARSEPGGLEVELSGPAAEATGPTGFLPFRLRPRGYQGEAPEAGFPI